MRKSIRLFWIFLFLSFSRSLCTPAKTITFGAVAFTSALAASTINKSCNQKNLRTWILNENLELEAPQETEVNYHLIKNLLLNEGIINPALLKHLSSSIPYLNRLNEGNTFFFHERNSAIVLLKSNLQNNQAQNILNSLDVEPYSNSSQPWGINESYPHAIFGGFGILNERHPISECINHFQKEGSLSKSALTTALSRYPILSDHKLNYESIVNDLLKTAKIISSAIFALQTNHEIEDSFLEKIPNATLYLPTKAPQNQCGLVISDKLLKSKTLKYSLIFFATEEDAHFAAKTLNKIIKFH